jgi:hypothetical protein
MTISSAVKATDGDMANTSTEKQKAMTTNPAFLIVDPLPFCFTQVLTQTQPLVLSLDLTTPFLFTGGSGHYVRTADSAEKTFLSTRP